MPETLETIAAKLQTVSASINALSKSTGERFMKIDQQFDETRAQLGVKIEAVDEKVAKVFDTVIAMREGAERNDKNHESFTKRLDNHDIRILALEKPDPSKS